MHERSESDLKRNILFYVSLVTTIFGSIWFVLYIFFQEYAGAIAVLSYSLLTALNFLIFRKIWDRPKYLSFIQIILILIMPGIVQLMVGGFSAASGVVFATVLAPLGALMFYKHSIARRVLFVFCVIIFLAGVLEFIFYSPNKDLNELFSLIFFVFNFVSIAVISFFILEYFVRKKIAFQHMIELKNKDINDSINYSKRIQNTFISSEKEIEEHFFESALLYLPKETVSGDFAWIIEKEGVCYFTVSDCTGHGVPGAMVSLIGLHAINQTIMQEVFIEPRDILKNVSNFFGHHFSQQSIRIQDGMDMSFCSYNPETRILKYAGALSYMYILRTKDKPLPKPNKSMEVIEGNNVNFVKILADRHAIGLEAFHSNFKQTKIFMEEGDRLVLYTDGYLDQFGGELNKKYKKNNFKKLLDESSSLSAKETKYELLKAHNLWKGHLEQTDDICVLIIDF